MLWERERERKAKHGSGGDGWEGRWESEREGSLAWGGREVSDNG